MWTSTFESVALDADALAAKFAARNLKTDDKAHGDNGTPTIPAPERRIESRQPPEPISTNNGPDWTGEKPRRGRQPTGKAIDIHRSPPHSVEAEQGVLGSMMISPSEVIPECVEKINGEYFYVPSHKTIYGVLVDLWKSGQGIDLITFTQVMRDRKLLDASGGASFVTHLYTFLPTAANVAYYIDIVKDKFILREIISASTISVRKAYDEQDEVNTLLDNVEHRILRIGEECYKAKQIPSMEDNVMQAIEAIESAYERKGQITGLATGFHEFDEMTSGLQRSEMIVIAARPSMGKTALALNIAEFAAVTMHKGVAIFSLEMSTPQLTQRMLCSRARVNLHKVRQGFLSERDFPALTLAGSKLSEAKIIIDDSSSMTILELRAKARRMHSQYRIELVIVDYLQLLRSDTKRAKDNRQIEISEISAGLKSLAKELNVPVVVLAQLNRQPEGRTGGRPRLSDLRESGAIEQDSDVVTLLYRPEIYEEDAEARIEKAGEAELIIAKQRNGPVGECSLTFIKEFTRFETRARNVASGDDESNSTENGGPLAF